MTNRSSMLRTTVLFYFKLDIMKSAQKPIYPEKECWEPINDIVVIHLTQNSCGYSCNRNLMEVWQKVCQYEKRRCKESGEIILNPPLPHLIFAQIVSPKLYFYHEYEYVGYHGIYQYHQDLHSLKRHSLAGIRKPMINLRRSYDRPSFIIWIQTPRRRCPFIEWRPRSHCMAPWTGVLV